MLCGPNDCRRKRWTKGRTHCFSTRDIIQFSISKVKKRFSHNEHWQRSWIIGRAEVLFEGGRRLARFERQLRIVDHLRYLTTHGLLGYTFRQDRSREAAAHASPLSIVLSMTRKQRIRHRRTRNPFWNGRRQ